MSAAALSPRSAARVGLAAAIPAGVPAALMGQWLLLAVLAGAGVAWAARRWGGRDTVFLCAVGVHFVFFDICRSPWLYEGFVAPFNFVWAAMAVGIVAYWTLAPSAERLHARHDWLLYVVLIYILADLFSVYVATWNVPLGSYSFHTRAWSPDTAARAADPVKYGLGGVVKNLGLYYLPLFVLAARRGADVLYRRFLVVLTVVAAIHIAHSILSLGWVVGVVPESLLVIRHAIPANLSRAAELLTRARGLYYNPNSLALLLMVTLAPLAARRIFATRGSVWEWVVLGVVGAGLVLTGSRAGVVGGLVILTVLCALARRWRVFVVLAGLSVAGIAIVASFMDIQAILDRFMDVSVQSDVGYSSRLYTFAAAWTVLKDHWLYGVGYNCPVVCDNEYLIVWLRGGLVTLGARLLLSFSLAGRSLALFRTAAPGGVAREIAAACFAMVCTTFLLDLFSGGFYAAPFVMAPFYLMGIAIARWHEERDQGVTESAPGGLVEPDRVGAEAS